MSNVIDIESARGDSEREVILTAAGQFEKLGDEAIFLLQTSSDQKQIEQAIATIRYLGAKLDELEHEGIEIE